MLLWWLACTCGDVRPPQAAVAPHYGYWNSLVRLVATGRTTDAQTVARDLVTGDVDGDREHHATIGAALGAMQVLDDADVMAAGVAKAAKGCGECHAAQQVVPSTTRPPLTHKSAAASVVWARVWGEPVPTDLSGVRRGFVAGEADDPVEAALLGCQACHTDR